MYLHIADSCLKFGKTELQTVLYFCTESILENVKSQMQENWKIDLSVPSDFYFHKEKNQIPNGISRIIFSELVLISGCVLQFCYFPIIKHVIFKAGSSEARNMLFCKTV